MFTERCSERGEYLERGRGYKDESASEGGESEVSLTMTMTNERKESEERRMMNKVKKEMQVKGKEDVYESGNVIKEGDNLNRDGGLICNFRGKKNDNFLSTKTGNSVVINQARDIQPFGESKGSADNEGTKGGTSVRESWRGGGGRAVNVCSGDDIVSSEHSEEWSFEEERQMEGERCVERGAKGYTDSGEWGTHEAESEDFIGAVCHVSSSAGERGPRGDLGGEGGLTWSTPCPSQESSSAVSSSAWGHYQEEYARLTQTLSSVHSAFQNALLSKEDGHVSVHEAMDIDAYVSKACVTSLNKYLSLDEKTQTNFDLLHFKLWKKHFCTLLDSLDIVYKDCQLLNQVSNHAQDSTKKGSTITEFKNTFADFLVGSDLSSVIEETHTGINVSTTFLTEIICQCRIFRGELERQNSIKDRLFYILKTAKDQRSKLKTYVTNLRNDLKTLLSKMKVVHVNDNDWVRTENMEQKPLQRLTNLQKQEYQKKIEDLERILKEEETRRKKLHNKLQELIGNIRVYCRIRPQPNSFLKTTSEDKIIVMGNCLPEKITKHWYGKESKCFIFDRVFGSKVDQIGVFECVEELITSCVDGYNVCIMAYGQTGSGKTHTMMGTASEPGVNRRAIQKLLDICTSRNQWNYCLYLSMVEIYQEEIRDLLSEKHAGNVKIMSNQDNEIMLHGLSEHEVKCERDIFRYFDVGERNRKVASTLLNITSSRSHLIVLLKVYGENKIHLTRSVGTLTLCDLAGSENVTKSGATGERFSEATCINKSLTTLGRVFDSLRKHQKPSYRETKLTYLLKPTLGGDSKCLLFINVRCEPENAEESLRALHFGINAMQVAPEKAQQRSKFRKTLGKISI